MMRAWRLILPLLIALTGASSLGQRAAYHRYDGVRAYLLRDGGGWRVRDFAALAFKPNHDPLKVTFRINADDPAFLFCASGPESCRVGPIYAHIILEAF